MDATVRQTAEDAITRVGHQQGVDAAFSGSRFVGPSRTTNELEDAAEEEVLRNILYGNALARFFQSVPKGVRRVNNEHWLCIAFASHTSPRRRALKTGIFPMPHAIRPHNNTKTGQ